MVYLFMASSIFAPIIFFMLGRKALFATSLFGIALNIFIIFYSGMAVELASPIVAVFLFLSQTLNVFAALLAVTRLIKGNPKEKVQTVVSDETHSYNVTEINSRLDEKTNQNDNQPTAKVETLLLGDGKSDTKRA